MPVYFVTAVRFDKGGEVQRVCWVRADPAADQYEAAPHEVAVDRVVEALDRGDIVMTGFPGPHGFTTGGRLARRVLPGGEEIIEDEHLIEGRGLEDLPKF